MKRRKKSPKSSPTTPSKRDGWSNLRSKTPRTSASTRPSPGAKGARAKVKVRATKADHLAEAATFGEALAIGHTPTAALAPQDETLFRAFQANLLSLISHELRTPLTGILNALSVLEEGGGMGEFSSE